MFLFNQITIFALQVTELILQTLQPSANHRIKNSARNGSSTFVRSFIAANTCLQHRCLVMAAQKTPRPVLLFVAVDVCLPCCCLSVAASNHFTILAFSNNVTTYINICICTISFCEIVTTKFKMASRNDEKLLPVVIYVLRVCIRTNPLDMSIT